MNTAIQGSPEWFQQRLGKVTASRVADVVARTKSGWGAARANYEAQLIAERLTGEVAESYSNAAMQWGTDTEPQARRAYEFRNGLDIAEVGFVDHPTIEDTGASPDGLVSTDGLVEIKCPNTATQINTLLDKKIETKYITQMQWQMACTERQWCDFVSFDPRLPESMRLFVERIHRDDERIFELENEIVKFLSEIRSKVEDLRSKFMPPTDAEISQSPLMAG